MKASWLTDEQHLWLIGVCDLRCLWHTLEIAGSAIGDATTTLQHGAKAAPSRIMATSFEAKPTITIL
jgi:hypothetical protein